MNNYIFGIRTDTRMTILAKETLERLSIVCDDVYYLQTPPTGIVAVLAPTIEHRPVRYMLALRMYDEPPFPGEKPIKNYDN